MERISCSYQRYLEIGGEQNLLFLDEEGKKIPYKDFADELEIDEYFFNDRGLCYLIIKTPEAGFFVDDFFGEERGYYKVGNYRYSEDEVEYVSWDDELKKFIEEWRPIFDYLSR